VKLRSPFKQWSRQCRKKAFTFTELLVVTLTTVFLPLLFLPAQAASIPNSRGADYQGDGLAVTMTDTGARLRCVFQRLEGEATAEGLWLTSTVTNQPQDRFRVVAAAIGRSGLRQSSAALEVSAVYPKRQNTAAVQSAIALPRTGRVEMSDKLVRFIRPGLVEEYTVSMDGVRQDFVVLERPPSPLNGERAGVRGEAVHETLPRSGAGDDEGALRLELAVTGARVEPIAGGAQLVLEKSGRKIAYSRLRVTDATGKELAARMEVALGILPDMEGVHPAARIPATESCKVLSQTRPGSADLEAMPTAGGNACHYADGPGGGGRAGGLSHSH
jgi:hypothetical protein